MKTISLILLAVILTASFQSTNTGNANTTQLQGVDVFVYSLPSRSFVVLDSGRMTNTFECRCHLGVNYAAERAAKLKADAVIVHLDRSMWKAIKFNP